MEFSPSDDPLALLVRFLDEASRAGQPLAEAMTLATVDESGRPHARIVLFKGLVGRALTFFTNYESDKARQLAAVPHAAVVFHFAREERQVRVEGSVSRLSAEQSDAYFATRPRVSQLGAWASQQSRPLGSRHELELRYTELEKEYWERPVPRPPHWGGYALEAERIELWSGQVGRLHDRGVYVSRPDGWEFERLYP
jgi:pyridoxamine 5'-phosphate oxidase